SGYSGVGKSSLVREVQKPIVERRGYFCSGKFDQFRSDLPYVGLLEAFRDLLRQLLTERADRIDALRADVLPALGPNGAVVTELLPELELIIGAQPPVPVLGSAESQARFNRVFESFVKVLARPERPLVLFIDDLQWADLASLQLLEVLSGDRSGGGLLIVGAYRDNEVERGHPLLGTIRHLEDAGHTVGRIQLEPLSESVVAALLADALYVDHAEVAEFAALAYEKTRGNPFFLGEFLQSLHLERLIYLDVLRRRWCWKLDRIRQAGITHNVADLMSRRIEQLAPRTRLVLQLASCIGAAFDLETIAIISDQTPAQTARDLAPALSLDLVLPSDVSYKYVAEFAEVAAERGVASDAINPRYRFLHDRVQQAAHAQLSPREQCEIHLQIGRHLLARVPADRLPDDVIEIVNHLDEGRELLEDAAERLDVARLNLLAGRRAKSAMAIGAAEKYLVAGIELLPPDAWESSYELALALHGERAAVAYIAGRFDVATAQAALVLEHARELLDRVPIYNVQIGMGVARNEYVEATYRGLEVLQQFGIKLPRTPTTRHILAGLVRTKLVLRGRTPGALLQLPEMTDPQARAVMEILMKTATNAYWGVPNLVALIAFAMVRLSVRRGNIGLSAYGYALMGMILSAAMGDVEGGYAFGKLASDLIDRTGARELAGKTRLLWDGFIRHVKDPLHDCASAMLDDYHAALDVGDVENAMYCVTVGYYTDFFAGRSLGALAERFEPYMQAALRSEQQQSIQVIGIWTQLVENLAARDRIEPRLVGTRFDYEASLPQFRHARAEQDLAQAGAAAGILAYLLGDVDAARRHFRLAVEHLAALRGQPHVCGILAYYALVLSEQIEQGRAHGDEQAVLRRIRRTLRKAARHNPRDYAPLRELVDGEHERIRERHAHAAAAFRRTMRQARAAGMVQIEALANERTARLYGATGDGDLERFYLQRAGALYRRWGAHAKVAQLERQIDAVAIATPAQLVSMSETETGRDEAAGLERLDFGSVMKSLRTLSAEIELDALLERIMDLVIQNAGARRGVLVLERDGTMFVESERSVGDAAAAAARPLDDYRRLPRSILDYTMRTKEPVLLASAADSPLFGRDPYIQAERPRSVLCMPLLRQGQLTGLVYLENDVSAAAFTRKHLTVLEMLCAQAAVSLQNARLYEHQRAMADSFARFVPKQFLQHLGKRSLLDVRLGEAVQSDITVLFSDLRNFTRLSESMSAEDNFALMNGYLARMEPVIQQHDGFIDKYIGDAVMALFSSSADRAVEAAIAMHRALDAYNEHRSAKGRAPLTMGIGIHTGPLMLGTVGSPDRMETTVIGDTVNVASRIENLTRRFGAALLITGETHGRLSDAARASCRIVGRFRMKGKTATTAVYEVVDADGPPARLAKRRTLAAFE
ncbi:MAG TPA: AAA family ATPase, partial [Candidatus Binatia bacterium]|nr:AAA family ATPase [Candidatus Binatia bacterium]